MNFLVFMGLIFIGVLIDRSILQNDNLWSGHKKTNKRGNYYVK
jgi:hypothetical protein